MTVAAFSDKYALTRGNLRKIRKYDPSFDSDAYSLWQMQLNSVEY